MSSTQTSTPPPLAADLRGHWNLHPDVHFLNHGSFGACPAEVQEKQSLWRAKMERDPVKFLGREILGHLDEARCVLAEFVGADPGGLVFVPNATTGVNSVLRSLVFEAGEEIVITSHGYNACNNVARFVTERAGATVVVADVPFPIQDPEQVLEAILACVNERTKIVLVDHITSPTALVFPVKRLVEELHERGVLVLIDGAHAPGMLELNLVELDADYYTGNCHKWLCAPKGAAFLWARADRREGLRPAVISHGANTEREGFTRMQDEFDWCGTDDPTAFLCVPEAIRFMGSLLPDGWDGVRRRNRELCIAGRALLLDALDQEAPAPESMLGSIASVILGPGEPCAQRGAFSVDPLQTRLFEEYSVEVPISTWPEAPGRLLRISAQLYNDITDVQALVAGLVGSR